MIICLKTTNGRVFAVNSEYPITIKYEKAFQEFVITYKEGKQQKCISVNAFDLLGSVRQ